MTGDPHSPIRLQEALDSRLSPEERLAVAEHVLGCEPCRRTLHALRWTRVRLAGAGAALPIPDHLERDLREALKVQAMDVALPATPQVAAADARPRGFWRRCLAWWSGGPD